MPKYILNRKYYELRSNLPVLDKRKRYTEDNREVIKKRRREKYAEKANAPQKCSKRSKGPV